MKYRLERKPFVLVITAPSGGGKSSVLDALRQADPSLGYSISYTSRPPRADEVDGQDYHFVTRKKFNAMIDADQFYEYAEVYDNLYGTSVEAISEILAKGEDIAMDIDVQGGLNIRRRRPDDSVLIYLLPPSTAILEERLRGRASDKEDQIELRLKNAEREMEHWNSYDYVIVNEKLEDAVQEVRDIVAAERANSTRLHVIRET